MPFGLHSPDTGIQSAIEYASLHNVIMLAAAAAAAYSGGGLAFPASAEEVIPIYSTDGYGHGTPSNFNPMQRAGAISFATLGENIRIPFLKRKSFSGVSFAATIAGGIAALVLDFALQHFDQVPQALLSQKGMAKVFQLMALDKSSQMVYIVPWRLLNVDEKEEIVGKKIMKAIANL